MPPWAVLTRPAVLHRWTLRGGKRLFRLDPKIAPLGANAREPASQTHPTLREDGEEWGTRKN
jgi:hypothetical protein